MKKTALFALGVILSFTNCEKDDICDPNTATTPQLVIEFFDIENPTVAKNVTSLQITGDGGNDALPPANNPFNGVSKIKLPLKTMADLTQYHFILNSGTSSQNEDELKFDYSRKDAYISRACGFKTLFTLNPNSPTLTDAPTADGLWIKNITVATPNINDENQTHVKIYF